MTSRSIERFAKRGLEGRFHRLGYRPDADRLLGEIDLLVHAARQEPFGTSSWRGPSRAARLSRRPWRNTRDAR